MSAPAPAGQCTQALPWVLLAAVACAHGHVAAQGLPFNATTAGAEAAANTESVLAPIDVRGNAQAQRRFDAAASFTSVEVDAFSAPTPLVNLSELLAGQAGVVALERQNYAQDLQISVRGFGARSTFGVRGVRILVDGIPATMPDGQGQVSHIDLASAGRIEVLRGPLAQLYGNAAGGVLQVTTREPQSGGGAGASVAVGSFGQRLVGASLDFGDRTLGGLVDVSHFSTDGWRAHSAARRTHLNGKLVARPDGDTTVTVLLNLFDQPHAQDPLGLTRAQFDADPRQVPAVAQQFDTRKSVAQNQLGLVLERRLSPADSLRLRVYGGTRRLSQFLSFSGAAESSAGGVVELDRGYHGAGVAWTHATRLASGLPLTWTLGLDADRLAEDRRGFVNQNGQAGALRRDERDRAGNTDLYAQVDALLSPTWRAVAGLRSSQVRLAVDDRYRSASNPDDSGARRWRQTSPTLGVVWSASEQLNLYANVGRGFETPTLAEMAYSLGNDGPNYALQAAHSQQAEIGAKWHGPVHRLDAAWFDARSRDEIVPAATVNGRTVYQNADRVRRRGLELAWSAHTGPWRPQLSYTYLDAFFASPYAVAGGAPVAKGNRLPGTARHLARLALDYTPNAAWQWGGEVNLSGKAFANDLNTEAAAGFAVLNLRAGYAFTTGASTRWQAWARLDNLLNRHYAGSLIVNDGNRRFFEPAASRRLMVGLRAQFF